jgi:hypothetical protein
MLVAASSIATPVDAGPVLAGFGSIATTPSGLLYATYVVQNNPPDLQNEYLAGDLLRVPLAGGQPTSVASGHLFVKPVVAGSVAILGERGGIPPGDGNDSIAELPFDGGPPSTIFNLATGNQLVNGIGTDGTFVYFDDLSGLQALPLAGGSDAGPITIVGTSLPTAPWPDVVGAFGSKLLFIYPQGETDTVALPSQPASQVTSLGTTNPGPTDLMACGVEACWLSGTQINGVDPAGGSIHVVVDFTGALRGAFDAVFDGRSFYGIGTVSNTSNGLVRVGTDGTCPELIATMPSEAGGSVAVDDECVYWANAEGIFSVAKTAMGPFAQ